MKLTKAQRALLGRLRDNHDELPILGWSGSRRRMLERLRDAALVDGPPWKITGIGEDALAEIAKLGER